jgi:hypothetical protein
LFHGRAAGQAMTEYGLGAAGAATGAKGVGGGIAGAFSSLDKALPSDKSATKTAAPAASRPSASPKTKPKPGAARVGPATPAEPASAAPPVPKYDDPNQIKVGMGYDELLRRFGPPAMEVTSGPSSKTLIYQSKEGSVHVDFLDEKVTAAQKPTA